MTFWIFIVLRVLRKGGASECRHVKYSSFANMFACREMPLNKFNGISSVYWQEFLDRQGRNFRYIASNRRQGMATEYNFAMALERSFVELVASRVKQRGWKKGEFAALVWPDDTPEVAAAGWTAMRSKASNTGKPQGVQISDARQMALDGMFRLPICENYEHHQLQQMTV
jgi:hypothetical protein